MTMDDFILWIKLNLNGASV